MEDREQLELAAKAAGYPIHSDAMFVKAGGGTETLYMGKNGPAWNPLTDDGDALRLAVKLRLEVDIGHSGIATRTPNGIKVLMSAGEEPDANAATRRAIVRAAASLVA